MANLVTIGVTMPVFELGADVHANVKALRVALGSVVTELSQAKLAGLLTEKHPERRISSSQVQRWEQDVEPDIESVRVMAELAGVTYEEFALGDPAKRADPFASDDMGIPESPSTRPYTDEDEEAPPNRRRGRG